MSYLVSTVDKNSNLFIFWRYNYKIKHYDIIYIDISYQKDNFIFYIEFIFLFFGNMNFIVIGLNEKNGLIINYIYFYLFIFMIFFFF
jgi:hypothetical protein